MITHLFNTMGTVALLQLWDPANAIPVIEAAEAEFTAMDDLYSLYKAESSLSRINRGELALADAPVGVQDTYAAAMHWRAATDGNFTPNMPAGGIDLAGIVKAQAIAAAGKTLSASGVPWLVNVGGDVLTRGGAAVDTWRCGIIDPDDRRATIMTVELSGERRAIATSGSAERGDHVWRNDMHSTLKQVSVLAQDIITADVLATAVLAGGIDVINEYAARWQVRVIAVTSDDQVIDAEPAG